jgi:hypothetical protein
MVAVSQAQYVDSVYKRGEGCYYEFKAGYYIDSNGNHIPGLLRFQYGGNLFTDKKKGDCRLVFKADSNTKSAKFTSQEIKGFVRDIDSFTVVRDFNINGFAHYPQDFARVIIGGPISLFEYLAINSSGGGLNFSTYTESFLIVSKEGKVFVIKHGNFKKIMEDLTGDYPELSEMIKTKDLKYKNLREIVQRYDEFKLKPKS